MGAAYNAAKTYSKKDEENKPSQNLAIVKTPLWGDEDIENCVVIDKADSEAQRIEKFSDLADKIVIFPGGAATLQEATTLISKNNYTPKEKRKKWERPHFQSADSNDVHHDRHTLPTRSIKHSRQKPRHRAVRRKLYIRPHRTYRRHAGP